MQVVNGWTIERDERGFWATGGTLRVGPFERPELAREHARSFTAPRAPKPKVDSVPKKPE